MQDIVIQDEDLIGRCQVNTYWSDDDRAYIAEMPELPGCVSDGPTESEARHNIRLIAQECLDTARLLGRPVPEPAQAQAFAC